MLKQLTFIFKFTNMDLLDVVKNSNLTMLNLLLAVPGTVSKREMKEAVLYVVRKGDCASLEVLLEKGGRPMVMDDHTGATYMVHATQAGHCDVLKLLLKLGADVNAKNSFGSTAMHIAASCGNNTAVKLLIDCSAKLNIRDSSKSSALILAAKKCHPDVKVMKSLVDAGCDLDIQDEHGCTALHYACHKAIGCELLLAAGAKPDVQNNDGNTPMILAATEGFDTVIERLCAHNCDPNIADSYCRTGVHYLAMKNHWKGIDAIGHHGGNVSLLDCNGKLPLWYACHYNRPDAVKALLRANSDLEPHVTECEQEYGSIPLHRALELRLFGVAKLLILAGCKLGPLYTWMADIRRQRSAREEHQSMLFVHQREEVEEDPEEDEAMEWFEDWMHSPHSLRQICRIQIRQHLGNCGIRRDDELPLPQAMRDYITLREIEDHPL